MPLDTDGRWSSAATPIPVPTATLDDGAGHTVSDDRGLFVIHAMLLRTGKILWFCGHVEDAFYAPVCYVFDPKNPGATLTPIPFPPGYDLFCCHYVQIPDGRILVVGGSDPNYVGHGSLGARNICLFDPVSERWSVSRTGGVTNQLMQGRWYPTPVLLPDGRVFVVSGRREHPDDAGPEGGVYPPNPPIADKVEILSPPNWTPTELSGASFTFPIYPGLHLAPNGRIYFTGTNWGQEVPNPETMSIEVTSGATSASWTPHSGVHPAQQRREEGMSVLLPPAQDGKILLIGGSLALDASDNPVVAPGGGGPATFDHVAAPTDCFAAEILNTTTTPPTWSSAPGGGATSHGRTNGHCVLLPDATVLVVGGHDNYKWLSMAEGTNPSLTAEIFTPGVGFRDVAAMNRPRMYHSAALLLPDGRVIVAGGANANDFEPGFDGTSDPDPSMYPSGWAGPTYGMMPLNDKTYEFYEPPYFFKGDRPTITDVQRGGSSSRQVAYGQTFTVITPEAASIEKVALMRLGSVTHHTDSEQRYVSLDFTKGSGELAVTAVDDTNIAPPGYYMLWIVDNQDRPCEEAVFVQLAAGALESPICFFSSCFIATAAFGSDGHPSILYLQRLRRDIAESTPFGRRFIKTVNKIYYSFSPELARYLEQNRAACITVRDWVVVPTVKAIGTADRTTRWIKRRGLRHILLMLLLTLEALLAVLLAPLILSAMLVQTLAKRIQDGEIWETGE